MSWETIRPDPDRFADLPDFDFEARYETIEGVDVHYLDEGSGPPVVLFHGEPTWSFLYRKIIRKLVAGGFRAIAPDYPGFGKSDTPTDPAFYTFDRHVSFMAELLERLDVADACAVVQDWGGPIGLRLAVDYPDRFGRLVIMNTGLFSGATPPPAFLQWRSFVEANPDLPVGMIMQRSAITQWSPQVFAAYEAPFPDAASKVGAHRFPLIVPIAPGDEGADEMQRVRQALTEWTRPAAVIFGTADPIFSPRVGERWVERVPGARELIRIDEAGHFLQEDQGDLIGDHIVAFLRDSA
ncbi:MAG: haloalkane dehalogenase [Acidimicrobiia bacterium]|nr:haloalkane dehalogenase [Acidimicrobiia bacterium]